ncbi:hypothetical protein EW026_g7394 [Hermanssonia centrifuga]|uniref:NADP-dependent oxidoreductase domain-containing protein n=1 Tax=Hermanssonia centrifuga TaxID=98765 RepID=A0A4S4K7Z3_9APHY|nr:hypothetical protein EW026_g7394 [Hermanssonia centrifuga]
MNEAAMGKAVRDSGVKREEVFVTSKIWYPDYGYESTLLCVDDSLEKIGLEYIDLYLIHSPETGKKSRLDTWRALIEQRNRGKLRTIGVSNFNVKHIEEIREAGLELPAVNQMEIHPYCQNRPIVEYCKKNGIVLQAYCPLIRGQFDNPLFVELADKYNKTIAQVLVRWSLQHGFSPLPKSSRAHRIKENADVHDFEISDEDIARLDALDKGDDGALEWNPIHVD